ncbi:DctP family TRAP transporter solute-binding subunit [Planococcus shenhongbingii]|uniref:DctP family TRAP transporter solute-binding subunit n=1 Tax=Planococcus shenhongbingii TaxID=3058398 RepID=A0ABT8NAW0_9BACL|nr:MULTISPECIES: DctP family TRAP transporter solute-binding subunit [unclassified Planococcus (in: firmicutes)]MDN7244986.1 DctP family TRAP transporter solute-binding subunit [Planococcus sp. N017]WKA58085.1 DctP family TRAP transporter solute-binding subunit [Planococcus sp. N016]
MKKFALSLFLLTSSAFLAACGSDEAASGGAGGDGVEEMTIKFSHVVAENTPKHQGALAMKEYIEAESDGKIEVEIYPNSSLFGDQEEYQNLVANNVQFIAPDLTKFVGNNPQFNVPALPFMFDNDEEAIAFWDGEKGTEILSSLEADGVLGLKMWPNGGKHLTNNERPIESPDDVKGLKFRTQGGQVLEALYSELGAGSESIPFSELYTALDQGVVDGQENTFSNIESKKFDEVQKYMTVMNHTRVDYAIFTNTEFWEGMNDATREIVEAGVEEGTKVAREEAITLNQEAYDLIKERGETEITELTPEQVEEFRKALEPIYDEFEEEIGADVYEAARKASGQ